MPWVVVGLSYGLLHMFLPPHLLIKYHSQQFGGSSSFDVVTIHIDAPLPQFFLAPGQMNQFRLFYCELRSGASCPFSYMWKILGLKLLQILFG